MAEHRDTSPLEVRAGPVEADQGAHAASHFLVHVGMSFCDVSVYTERDVVVPTANSPRAPSLHADSRIKRGQLTGFTVRSRHVFLH